MKKTVVIVLALLLVLSAVSIFANAEDPAPAEPKVATAIYGTPIIDGVKDQLWENAQINKVEGVASHDDLTEPCAAQFRVAYDEKYIYFFVEVLDNTMPSEEDGLAWENQGDWYKRDGVSFCFAPDGDKSHTGTQVEPAFWYILRAFGTAANYNNVPQNVFVTEAEGAVQADQNNLEKQPMSTRMYFISYKKNTDGTLGGYTIECKINLKARYADFKAEPGREIGFEMGINNNNYILLSANRDYSMVWADLTGQAYKDNQLKGTIVLADQNKKFTNTAEDEKLVIPNAGEETTAEEQTTASVGDVTTKAPAQTTKPETTTENLPVSYTTPAEAEGTEAAKSSGCGSAAIGAAMIVSLLGAAYIFKKH